MLISSPTDGWRPFSSVLWLCSVLTCKCWLILRKSVSSDVICSDGRNEKWCEDKFQNVDKNWEQCLIFRNIQRICVLHIIISVIYMKLCLISFIQTESMHLIQIDFFLLIQFLNLLSPIMKETFAKTALVGFGCYISFDLYCCDKGILFFLEPEL